MLKTAFRAIGRAAGAALQNWSTPHLDWQRDSGTSMKARVAKSLTCPHPLIETRVSGHNPSGIHRYCPHEQFAHHHHSHIVIKSLDDQGAEWQVTGPDGFPPETAPDIETAKAIAEHRALVWRNRPEPSRPVSPAEADILRHSRRP